MLCSCTTMEKFTVNGVPGTTIYTDTPQADGSRSLGVIPADGKLKLKVPSNAYYGILLAQEPGSDLRIPFGADMKKNSHFVNKAVLTILYPASIIGVVAMVTGLIMGVGGAGGIVTAAGLALGGVSAGGALVASSRMDQMSHDWNFGYQKQQYSLTSAGMQTLQNVDLPKVHMADGDFSQKHDKAISDTDAGTPTTSKSTKSKKEVSTKSKRSLKEASNDIVGEFIGTGTLKSGTQYVEEYDKITMLITKDDKNHVLVQVLEGGQEFFEEPLTYVVSKTKKGAYQLKMEDLPTAVITINEDGQFIFSHPRVNIDGEIYTLTFTGRKS